MGGVGNELALLLPGPFHRLYRPGSQPDADTKKCKKAEDTDEDTVLDQIVQGGLLAGNVRKDNALSKGTVYTQKAQMILLQFSKWSARPGHLPDQLL